MMEQLPNYKIQFSNTVRCDTLFKLAYQLRQEKALKEHGKLEVRHQNKLEELLRSHEKIASMPLNDRWVCNPTNVQVPEKVERILQLGPEFCFSSSSFQTSVRQGHRGC